MTLDELLTALGHADQTHVLPNGFNNPHSYRGYYDELAFEPAENISVADMAAAGWAAMDETFEGYKGGQFTMTGDTDCWLSFEGWAGGEPITTELLARLLAAGARPTLPGEVFQAPGNHVHFGYRCSTETGGCGYESPFHTRTEAAAQQGLDGHRATCTARPAGTDQPVTGTSGA
ncbi:hypothetical protein ACH4RG_23410 [Streptomyces sp. NPDC021019]|uniref:hypothetical protein n=1 Tax=Streptomyces sp. NPDC021019 TaxID=3365108 RepID=UPI0037AF6DFA